MPKRFPTQWDVDTGRRIRVARLSCGMTQEGVAGRMGVTFQAFQKIEKGLTKLGAQVALQLADMFDVDVRVILGVPLA